jgi:hypothetical protein
MKDNWGVYFGRTIEKIRSFFKPKYRLVGTVDLAKPDSEHTVFIKAGETHKIESVELADPKSKATITIVQPHGAEGRESAHDLLEAGLRAIAEAASSDKDGWAEKYGANYENETFTMCTFCWCDGDNCPSCSGAVPNFLYKPTGFTVTWYKYIGRSMELSEELSAKQLAVIVYDCLRSLDYERWSERFLEVELEELKRFIIEDGYANGCECEACMLAVDFIQRKGWQS